MYIKYTGRFCKPPKFIEASKAIHIPRIQFVSESEQNSAYIAYIQMDETFPILPMAFIYTLHLSRVSFLNKGSSTFFISLPADTVLSREKNNCTLYSMNPISLITKIINSRYISAT